MTSSSNRAAKTIAAGALGALIFLASSGPLLAQAAPAAPTAASPAPAATTTRHTRSAAEFVEVRISDLHEKLDITAAQEPQFKAYADVMRSNAATMQSLFQERAQSTGPNTVDNADNRLHWYAKLTAAHADAVDKLVPVFDSLYFG